MATLIPSSSKTKAVIRKQGYPTKCKTFTKRSDALVWAKKTESEMERGLYIDNTKAKFVTLETLLDQYYQYCQSKQLKALKFIKAHSRIIKRHLGQLKLVEVNSYQLALYRDKRLETVSPATVKIELGIVVRTIKLAVTEWGYRLNETPSIEFPKVNNARHRRLVRDEMSIILKAISNKEVRVLIELAIETAMRRGELLNIKYEHIDWIKRTLTIPDTKTNVARTIPLTNRALELLKPLSSKANDRLFSLKPDSVSQAFSRGCAMGGITDLRFHDLRHEGTTRFFEMGLNVMEVATITGHKDLKMLNRYTHLKAENIALKLA
tara:strand:+ start:1205 stop:2170 length:966 start_codon:yes stop_codon:yes gene_type:complete